MKSATALAIAGIAITLLIIGFPLLQSKAAQFELKRQSEADRATKPSDLATEAIELGLSLELSRKAADARETKSPAAAVKSSGWRNFWLMPLAALPLLAGLVISALFSAFRPNASRQVAAPEPRDLVNRLALAEAAIAERDRAIAQLKQEVEQLSQAPDFDEEALPNLEELEAQLAARDEIIKGLEETLDENHERWMNVEISESDRQERVLRLESELRTASAIIHSLEDDVAEWKSRANTALPVGEEDIKIQSAAGN